MGQPRQQPTIEHIAEIGVALYAGPKKEREIVKAIDDGRSAFDAKNVIGKSVKQSVPWRLITAPRLKLKGGFLRSGNR